MTKFVFTWQGQVWEIYVLTNVTQLVHLSDVVGLEVSSSDIGIKSFKRTVIIPMSSVAYTVITKEQ